ncbi:PAS domain-containing hybrid sensor histidine kinase/response regulator [Methylomagnum ishizawai]|uniref:PAS domain-containing hybrid sensor histidine kinase/response regulator n=1 Tax=Methylomagnum ishizawai TaxID=1760988 RepID=UPI001C327368|nr:PAS domain-containing sensor histidine kinase [Methylomagnum ishizawai]BBL75970.1 hypothetical protein MishRS11D_30680 [Methylomagnum ishizawai]
MDEVFRLLTPAGFMPHGYCLSWSPWLLWAFVVSDGLIFASYLSLPVALGYFARHRRDFPYVRVLWLFAIFILACGMTHLMGVVVLWKPLYWLDVLFKAFTALVSLLTAVVLWPLMPRILSLPNPAELREANERLHREIAERERAEVALKAANEMLEWGLVAERTRVAAIVESSGDAIIGESLEGFITSWNPAAERIFGYPAGEAVGRPALMLRPPEFAAMETEIAGRIAGGERIDNFEATLMRKDGGRIDISETLSPIKDRQGQVVGMSRIARDITEHKRDGEALRESEERFRLLVEAMAIIVWETDPAGELMGDVSGWRSFSGQTPEEWSHEGWANAIHPEDRERALSGWQTAVRLGAVYNAEYRLRRVDGVWRWASVTGTPVRSEDGRILKWVGMISDITERKQAEAALLKADSQKNVFLAMLAHELRNPLAPITHAVQILRRPGLKDAQLAWCRDVIDRQAGQMTRLVDDLLDISRITRGKIELRKEPLAVADLMLRAVETSRPLINDRRHELTVHLPPEPILIEGDRVRLIQVVSNLLNNAAKYTDTGGRIGLSVECDGAEVGIRVRDTGQGLDPRALPHVFDLFYQTDRTLDRPEGGLGIGLSLVKRLVDLHGGTVQAFSAGRGRGSEFVVRLPRLPDPPTVESVESVAVAMAPSSGLHILVVDDNRDAADSLALLLESDGHRVRAAYDGEEGLKMALAEPPQVVLLDIGLPGMDGYAVARTLRQSAELKGSWLIALTGYGQAEDREKSRAAGFDRHLVKPVDFEALQGALAEYRVRGS